MVSLKYMNYNSDALNKALFKALLSLLALKMDTFYIRFWQDFQSGSRGNRRIQIMDVNQQPH